MLDFLYDLSVIGWIGLAIRIAVILSVPLKPKWWFDFHERMPKLKMFDDLMYTEVHIFIFMGIRLVVLMVCMWTITSLMFMF